MLLSGVAIVTAISGLFLQEIWIRCLRRLRIGQVAKWYGPQGHTAKTGTPTMGGVVFLALPLLALLLSPNEDIAAKELFSIWGLPWLAAAVGLFDDLLKYMRRSGEGLSSLHKLLWQAAVVLPWAIFVSLNMNIFLWHGLRLQPLLACLLLSFLTVGFLNAVNVTDGLDGLAAGSAAISFAVLLFCFRVPRVMLPAVVGLCAAGSFLWHNAYPAKVFMGDVGAHFLGGLLMSATIQSGPIFLIVPLGWLFGVEALSVIVQIISLRLWGRRIFRMSPLHHHFELLGWRETHIVARFWIFHALGMALLFMLAHALFGPFPEVQGVTP
ncbi:phospho-N-acetylmuramoyl-pentapeptide-transferase [Acetomicrobium sp. S15 = DSM 107314]|uniref:phospho-N-acetylmuramoyl-pentapeptide- transferase n=1 Tax=Acetomicrobium sp. S15 = DSM 107314 TaxID=2529858 RepID=UPI0018E14C0C|nr:phospho-N-acetylmuramoyl-pentapeptide-transferase [Acetomicrobium sp. S15 = DSM 107314]